MTLLDERSHRPRKFSCLGVSILLHVVAIAGLLFLSVALPSSPLNPRPSHVTLVLPAAEPPPPEPKHIVLPPPPKPAPEPPKQVKLKLPEPPKIEAIKRVEPAKVDIPPARAPEPIL